MILLSTAGCKTSWNPPKPQNPVDCISHLRHIYNLFYSMSAAFGFGTATRCTHEYHLFIVNQNLNKESSVKPGPGVYDQSVLPK